MPKCKHRHTVKRNMKINYKNINENDFENVHKISSEIRKLIFTNSFHLAYLC